MNLRPLFLSLFSASLILSSCQTGPSKNPINTTLNLNGLPAVEGSQLSLESQEVYNFKIITPMKHVDAFSILQVTPDTPSGNTQVTLPVAQLNEVKVAKERIIASEFLKPSVAGDAAHNAASFYAADTELARQIFIEISSFYTNERNAQYLELSKRVIENQKKYREQNRRKLEEINKTNEDFVKEGFPQRVPLTVDERKKWILAHVEHMNRVRIANLKKIKENNKQAQAALQDALVLIKERREKNKKRAELLRQQLLKNVENFVKDQKKPFTLMNQDDVPAYHLLTLNSGEFLLEADSATPLPSVIELNLTSFEHPIPLPVLNYIHPGRVLVSIGKDTQGFPLIYGGYEAELGGKIDLAQPLFSIEHSDTGYIMDFLNTDGISKKVNLNNLKNRNAKDLNQFDFIDSQELKQSEIEVFRSHFSSIHYVLTPDLNLMQPDQALDILNSLSN